MNRRVRRLDDDGEVPHVGTVVRFDGSGEKVLVRWDAPAERAENQVGEVETWEWFDELTPARVLRELTPELEEGRRVARLVAEPPRLPWDLT